MRLLRLTTRKPTADFESLYSDSIILQPNSKMALQSVSINSNDLVVEINTDNNEIQYGINASYTKTIQLTPRKYNSVDVEQLLTDITNKLNDSVTFSVGDSTKALGLEWLATRNDNNLVQIGYEHGRSQVNLDQMAFSGTTNTNNPFGQILARTDNDSNAGFTTNITINHPLCRGNGFLRCRTRRLNNGVLSGGAYTKAGYILGVYTDGDLVGNEVTLEKIKYGIYVNVTGTLGGGDRVQTYQVIKDGALVAGTTTMDTYVEDSTDNEYQEVAINGDKVELNIYRSGSNVPVSLFDNTASISSITYNQEDLRPIMVFHGGRTGTQIIQERSTLSPFNPVSVAIDNALIDDVNLNAPTPAKVGANTDKNFLFFKSALLSLYLGYDTQRIPVTDFLLGKDMAFIANREFDIPQEADAMLVQLMNLQIESYDSYSDSPLEGNGQRSNILSVIPSKSSAGKIVYEPPYPTFVALNNKDPITLRNLHIRILREDYSEIFINGLATIVVLIE